MMIKLVFLFILLFTLPTMAHFKLGDYSGVLSNGDVCTFSIDSVSFEGGVHHPLAERVIMTIGFLGDTQVEMKHLAIINAEAGTVRPKKEVLSAYWVFESGAKGLELFMNESGPSVMVAMIDHYRDSSKSTRSVCAELKYLGPVSSATK
jgi:hypothetical protein